MQEEIFPLVNIDGNVIGQASRSKCHDGTKLLHPVVHLHIFNSKGELYMQKRSLNKDVQPGKWDSSVAGHIDLGETSEIAVMREAGEELSIFDFTPHLITKYVIETNLEKELSYCYYTIYNGKFVLNSDELSDGRFWRIEEIQSNLGKDIFTSNFESDFRKFLSKGLENLIREY